MAGGDIPQPLSNSESVNQRGMHVTELSNVYLNNSKTEHDLLMLNHLSPAPQVEKSCGD